MLAVVLAIMLIGGVIVLLWVLFHAQISQGIVWLRQGQMELATHWIDEDQTRLDIPPTREMAETVERHRGLGDPRIFEAWRSYLPNADGESFKFKDFGHLTALSLEPYKYPFLFIMLLMGLHVYFKGPMSQYRRKFTLDSLIKEQAKIFPQVSPFIKFNPSKQIGPRAPGEPVPVNLPEFAEALGPEEWIAYHQIPLPDGKLNEKEAKAAFAKQLGERWRGPKKLPPYQQILLAAFCLKAARKRKESDDILGRIAKCWDVKDGLKLSRDKTLHSTALRVLRNSKICGETIKATRQHAFVTTALLRALDHARSEGGVLAPAQFVWLRGFDRDLWYPLNNLGKQTHHTEALGAMCHYKEEKRSQRPIPVPKVELAVKSISDHMKSDKARPVPMLDYDTVPLGRKKKQVKGLPKTLKDRTEAQGRNKGIMKPVGSN